MATGPIIEVVNASGGDEDERLRELLISALRCLGKEDNSVEVVLVSDEEMQEINRRSRGKNEPAAVLSFREPNVFPNIPGEPLSLGEIYLAPSTIERSGENLYCLALHGLLHLVGYTHKTKRDTMEMERIERKLWRILSLD